MISRAWKYLNDPAIVPRTASCRIKVWAHDNGFTVFWITLWALLIVVVCR